MLIEDQLEYAVYIYTKAIEESKDTDKTQQAEAYLQRATCYMKMQKFDEAVTDINEALKCDKNNTTGYRKLSKCFLILGDIKQAKQSILNFLNASEGDNEKQFARNEKRLIEEIEDREIKANEAYKKEDYQQVVKLMDECLEKSEMCHQYKLKKAECLIYLSHFTKALETINEILFTNKDHEEALFLRGLNHLYRENYRLGLEDLKTVMFKNKQAKALHNKYKNVEKSLNDSYACRDQNLSYAKETFQLVLKLDAKNLQQKKTMYKELTKISLKESRFHEALTHITNALLIKENDIEALKLRAETSTELKEYADALEDYATIVKLDNSEMHRAWLEEAKDNLICNKIDHYKVLGVFVGCTEEDITRAWKKLALSFHPDKLSGKTKAEQLIGKRKYNRIYESYQKLLTQQANPKY